jgi:hypothetical protein
MTAFAAKHVRRSHTIHVDAAADDVFPLLTPAGEERWVDGWKPAYLHPRSGETQAGMVFTTGAGDDFTCWMLADYDPVRHTERYVRVTPASRFGIVEVACEPEGARRTRVTVSYTYTALTEAGNAFIDAFTEESYREMLEEWRRLMTAHLARTR